LPYHAQFTRNFMWPWNIAIVVDSRTTVSALPCRTVISNFSFCGDCGRIVYNFRDIGSGNDNIIIINNRQRVHNIGKRGRRNVFSQSVCEIAAWWMNGIGWNDAHVVHGHEHQTVMTDCEFYEPVNFAYVVIPYFFRQGVLTELCVNISGYKNVHWRWPNIFGPTEKEMYSLLRVMC